MDPLVDVTIRDLFPKLFLFSRQNPVTKIRIGYDRPSQKAPVTNPSVPCGRNSSTVSKSFSSTLSRMSNKFEFDRSHCLTACTTSF